jgi:hypothetical protein
VLTADRSAPCGATTYNTNAVEIEALEPKGVPAIGSHH